MNLGEQDTPDQARSEAAAILATLVEHQQRQQALQFVGAPGQTRSPWKWGRARRCREGDYGKSLPAQEPARPQFAPDLCRRRDRAAGGQRGRRADFRRLRPGYHPLAGLIGTATEEIAGRTGPQIGGLLNATLGNAAELIITIFALREGLLELVRASIIGSVLGNLLLVMGLAILLGGLKHGIQTFDRRRATMNATLVIMAFMALAIPSLFDATFLRVEAFKSEQLLSEGIAVILILLYAGNIAYSLLAHKDEGVAAAHHAPRWSTGLAVAVLAAATLGIVVMSSSW